MFVFWLSNFFSLVVENLSLGVAPLAPPTPAPPPTVLQQIMHRLLSLGFDILKLLHVLSVAECYVILIMRCITLHYVMRLTQSNDFFPSRYRIYDEDIVSESSNTSTRALDAQEGNSYAMSRSSSDRSENITADASNASKGFDGERQSAR